MGVFYGLLTAAGFGTADFFVTRAARRIGPFRALYLIQLFGLLAMLAVALARQEGPPEASHTWVWMVLLSLLSFGGMLCLYRAFTVGSLALCSPIAASYAVVTGILAYAAGERPPGPSLAGAAVLVVGVAAVARGSGRAGAAGLAGVPEALGAALFLGITFWGVDGVVDEMGWLWPVIILRAVMLLCGFTVVSRLGEASPRPEPGTGRFIVLAALLDSLALVSLNLGLERTFTTTTAALGSLYSAVAVLLAWLFLRERLARAQWAGIAIILAGVLLVSL